MVSYLCFLHQLLLQIVKSVATTVPAVSMGKRLMEAKQYVEVTDLFAWTVMVVLCSLIIEKVLMAAVGRLGKRYAVGGADK